MSNPVFIKAKVLFGSLRFWLVTSVFVTAILQGIASGSTEPDYYFNAVKVWLTAVVGIGTLDSVAQKYGAAKAGAV